MNGKHQRGGRAYHSVLEPHFDFIREKRQRRKTWKEIAELLHTEKGIRVTLYAPYHFYRRKLKRAKLPHWENAPNVLESQPVRPIVLANRPESHPAPLPASPAFKRPDYSKFNMDQFT